MTEHVASTSPGFEFGLDEPAVSASLRDQSKASDFKFEQQDWIDYRSLETLPRRAGVPLAHLARLVLKELADNALDTGAAVRVGEFGQSSYFVEDDGPGIPPAEVPTLFSMRRSLLSSKRWRLPTRGAMGNGLRVVAGAIYASSGSIRVRTRNRLLVLEPRDDGSTAVLVDTPISYPVGTRVEIRFGLALPSDRNATFWANYAVAVARGGRGYEGKTSPFWYDPNAFWELLQAARGQSVRDLVSRLDGCSEPKAGQIAAPYRGRMCDSMSREEATNLLLRARERAKPVRPDRLGAVGLIETLPSAYALVHGELTAGIEAPPAEIPYAVEAWVRANRQGDDRASVMVLVNRTPITGTVNAYKDKSTISLYGCNLSSVSITGTPKGACSIVVNITTPYCPMRTLGKEPDLAPFRDEIVRAIEKAMRRARRDMPADLKPEGVTTQKGVLEHIKEGIAKASGDGAFRFNLRQLFYVLRPRVVEHLGGELSYGNFEKIITDHEEENGPIPGMYRDPRGSLYHPHTRESIPLGTIAVERYKRPEWTFNRILYCEKEGLTEILKATNWPERWDCALVSSKGYASRAVRDLLDLLGDGDEPLTIFCVHDADAYGTMIFETLQEETRARGRRRVSIVNLGLEPWQAISMGPAVEPVERAGTRRVPVADYVADRADGEEWCTWLQANRIELNEMNTPAFIAWLDSAMREHGGGKVVPPADHVGEEFEGELRREVERVITKRILAEAKIGALVDSAVDQIETPHGEELLADVTGWVELNRSEIWRKRVQDIAANLASRD